MHAAATRNLTLLSAIAFLNGFRTFEGILAIYFASITGSFTFGMTIFAILNLSAAFFEIPTGIMSDRRSRKTTISLYVAAGLLATTCFYFATSAHLLILGATLLGLAMALQSGAISGFVYENLAVLDREEDFKKIEGKRRAMRMYALAVGGVLGAVVIYFFDIKTAILFSVPPMLAALLLTLWIVEIPRTQTTGNSAWTDLRTAWKLLCAEPSLRDLSIGRIIARGAGNVEFRFRSLFFELFLPIWVIKLISVLDSIVSGVSMQASHFIIQKLGVLKSLVLYETLSRALIFILITIPSIGSAIAISLANSVSFGMQGVATEDLSQARYSKEQRATMGSLIGFGSTLLYAVLAIGVGALADWIGLIPTMLILQPLLLLAPLFFYRSIKATS